MRLAAIALLTLSAVGLFFLLSESPGLAPVSSLAAAGVPDPPRHAEPLEATSLQEAGPGPEDRTELEEAVVVEEGAQTEAPMLEGRVVLTDDSGMELSHVNGAITLILWKGNSGGHEECQVSDGAFELSVEDTERLSVSELLIDGRHAVLDELGRQFPVDEGPIIVRVHWPKSLVLNVVGQEAGAHLRDIVLLRGQGWFSDTSQHLGRPNSSQRILTDGYSPLELHPNIQESNSPDTLYFVHSPGFAWKAIHLDLYHGGEREIRLEVGGDLEVQVVGGVLERGAYLRLRESDATDSVPYTEVGFRKPGRVEISGLAPGTYRVTAERGRWYGRPPVLGEAEVEIKAGERAQVELQVELPLKPVPARLAGKVVVPQAWKLSSFFLEAKADRSAGIGREGRRQVSMQEMEKLAGQPPTWSFEFGELPTGPYSLDLSGSGELGEIEYSLALTLEPGAWMTCVSSFLRRLPSWCISSMRRRASQPKCGSSTGERWDPPGGAVLA